MTVEVRNRYWVLHEGALVRALERVDDGEITVAEAIAELEEHSETEEQDDG